MLHTIQEAMKLTGVSRRTLYNHSDAGRVAYSVGNDGRRYYETAELERAYGKLATVAHSVAHSLAHENAQTFTPPSDASELARMMEDVVARATAPMVAQLVAQAALITDLRETLMRIEHQPDTPAASEPTAAKSSPGATRKGQSDHSPSVSSFADLLSSFE